MGPAEEKVIDKLFRGEITISMASKELDVSIDEIHKILDDYEYVPTIDEECEVQNDILENLILLNQEYNIRKAVHAPTINIPTASEEFPLTSSKTVRCENQLPNASGDYLSYRSHPYDNFYHG